MKTALASWPQASYRLRRRRHQAVGGSSARNGEIIMDYSIHDAIEAGLDKIVFYHPPRH